MGQAAECNFILPHARIGFKPSGSISDFASHGAPKKATEYGMNTWSWATHALDLDKALGFWLQPSPTGCFGHLEGKTVDAISHPLCLSISDFDFLIQANISEKAFCCTYKEIEVNYSVKLKTVDTLNSVERNSSEASKGQN